MYIYERENIDFPNTTKKTKQWKVFKALAPQDSYNFADSTSILSWQIEKVLHSLHQTKNPSIQLIKLNLEGCRLPIQIL